MRALPVRLAAEHAAPYRALMLHGYQHAPDAFTTASGERDALPLWWWAQRLAHPQGLTAVWGVLDGDGPALAGTVTLEFSAREKTRHKAQLLAMYVLPSCCGRGVARALVDAALAEARARAGLRTVGLTVTAGNSAAIALYQRAGFQAFGTEPMAVRTPDGYLDKIHMWCDLAPGAAPSAPAATATGPRS